MADIVERLRKEANCDWNAVDALCGEAADEIIRLRALINDACDTFADHDMPDYALNYRSAIIQQATGKCDG